MTNKGIELLFDLFTLPTAQHRAGLAGFLVLVESMRRRNLKLVPEVTRTDGTELLVHLTEESLQAVFDDLYDAFWDERRTNNKPQGKRIRNVQRIDTSQDDAATGKRETLYMFEAEAPKAAFLKALGMPDLWLKLWRESLWATLRGGESPQTRKPYEQRAEGKHVGAARDAWKKLQNFEQAQAKNLLSSVGFSSSIYIGAQAANAERVPFRGRADEVFLLHFWPVVMGVYVPEVTDREGNADFKSYVLTVPDVSDVDGFVQDFLDAVPNLGNEVAGYRPRQAVISIPQEGGLEYLHHLVRLAKDKAQAGEILYNLASVEVYHLEKQGNSMHVLSADRVAARGDLLEEYEAIRGRYHDPIFKRQIILNLLRGEPWYRGFERAFAKNDLKRFIGSQAELFSMDSQRRFATSFQKRRSLV